MKTTASMRNYQKKVPRESPPIRSLRNAESGTPCFIELSI